MSEYEKGLRERIASGEEIDWEKLSRAEEFNKLSNEFVKEFADKFDWQSISRWWFGVVFSGQKEFRQNF